MEATQAALWAVLLLVLMALAFDFLSGFHDAAHSIATVVSTGVLKPAEAVVFAAFFNLLAMFVFSLGVAATVAKGVVDPAAVNTHVLFGALLGAIAWNLLTRKYGVPSSTSHALIGGLAGAALAKAGVSALVADGLWKIGLFFFVAPVLGFLLASLLMLAAAHLFRRMRPSRVDRGFRPLQLASAAAYSLGHGGNSAQKTIGFVWLLLLATGSMTADEAPPGWLVVSGYVAIALGTLFGGWRVIKTRSQRITKLKPVGGFCAETGGAITLFLATGLGIPVSTTHTITGAVIGVGATQRASAVRWGMAGNIVGAWLLTIPASALLAAIAYWLSLRIF